MKSFFISLLIISMFASCKKYIEPGNPKTQLTSNSVFNDDATAIAAQLSIYAQIEVSGLFYSLSLYPGLSADEFSNYSFLPDQTDISVNNITPANFHTYQLWSDLYHYIYQANAMLEGVGRSARLSTSVSNQLRGEALFVRALCHYYLVNLFGFVPIISTTNYELNSKPSQASPDSVYHFIIADILQTKELLAETYQSGTNGISSERVRPNKWAASALLARVYHHQHRWADAEAAASTVINAGGMYQLVDSLNEVFLKNSPEAIWQLMAVLPGFNTYAGGTFILTSSPYISSIAPAFMNAYQAGDLRKSAWTASFEDPSGIYYYPFKYRVPQNVADISEYTMVLRLAEQFLIRAEARVMQDNLTGAEADLNLIRERAGLPPVTGLSKQAIIDSIQTERKFELAFETGDRWINLKRTGKASDVLSVIKGNDWMDTDQLYPIPLAEMDRNPNLVQNAGY